MTADLSLYLQIFVALFTIIDPLGAVPLFLILSADQTREEKRKIIKRTVFSVILILLISAVAGKGILFFFGIDIYAFQIAGGIVLMLIAFDMLQAKGTPLKTTPHEQNEALDKEDISVVPLAIPMLAGPGSIGLVILFSTSMETLSAQLALCLIITAASLTIWPILLLSRWIGDTLGRTGINIAVRIMGLIVLAVSVKFILEGVKSYF